MYISICANTYIHDTAINAHLNQIRREPNLIEKNGSKLNHCVTKYFFPKNKPIVYSEIFLL